MRYVYILRSLDSEQLYVGITTICAHGYRA